MSNKFEIVSVSQGNGDIIVWKLGNPDKGILPTTEDLEAFRKMLISEKIEIPTSPRKWWHLFSTKQAKHVVVPNIVDISIIRMNP